MAKLGVTLGQVNITDYLLFIMREVESPIAEVYRQNFAPPHDATRIFVVNDMNPVNHYVDWWRSNSNGDMLELLHTTEVDLSMGDATLKTIDFLVGGDRPGTPHYDPALGATQYVNPDLDGIADYIVFKLGYGPLTWDIDIESIAGGGFQYINGDVFADYERYTLMFIKIGSSGEPASRGFITDFLDFTEDLTFGIEHYGKMLEANAAANLTLTIDDMAAIPDKTFFGINTEAGTQKSIIILLPFSAFCYVNGLGRNIIYIGRGEDAIFMKKGNTLKVVSWSGDQARVGQRVKADGNVPLNGLPTTGGWVNKTDILRLLNWHILKLPMGEAINGTDNTTPSADDRTKYIIGQDKVWIQDRGGYMDRNIDPDQNIDTATVRSSGVSQPYQTGSHTHVGLFGKSASHASASTGRNGVIAWLVNILSATPLGDSEVSSGRTGNVTGLLSDTVTGHPANVASNEYVII